MSTYFKATITSILFCACFFMSQAQDTTRRSVRKPITAVRSTAYKPPAQTVVTDKSLRGQYQYLMSKTYNYQQPMVSALYKNFMDTLNLERRKVKDIQAKLNAQNKTVKDLQADVSTKEQSLSESTSKVDSISLLGIPVTKSTYNFIMWGLVILFGIVATIVILRSGSNSREAKYRTKLYEELDEEYKAYKVKANEKEKKLARELQTERNKLDELLGRG